MSTQYDFTTMAEARKAIEAIVTDASTKEGQREVEHLFSIARIEERDAEPTVYVSLTGTESYNAWNAGLCVVCASKMKGGDCVCRYCDSCSSYWISDTYRDGDDGRPAREDCGPCVEWFANLHLTSEAPQFVPGEWMETDAVANYRLQRMREAA